MTRPGESWDSNPGSSGSRVHAPGSISGEVGGWGQLLTWNRWCGCQALSNGGDKVTPEPRTARGVGTSVRGLAGAFSNLPAQISVLGLPLHAGWGGPHGLVGHVTATRSPLPHSGFWVPEHT